MIASWEGLVGMIKISELQPKQIYISLCLWVLLGEHQGGEICRHRGQRTMDDVAC